MFNAPASRRFNKAVALFSGYLFILIAWKTALWLVLPLPTVDGGQSLSHTYSILRGDFLHSSFWHHWMNIFQLPYGYGLFTAPLMGLLPFGTLHNFYAASLILTLSTAALTYGLLVTPSTGRSRTFAAVAAAALFVYPQLWALRPESITLPLLLIGLLLVRQTLPRLIAVIGSALVIVFAGLTHPIGGLIGVLILTFTALENRWHWKVLIAFYEFVVLFLALFYLPVILIDVDLWVYNFLGFFTREEPRGFATLNILRGDLPRFLGWGAPLVFLYVRGLWLSWRQAGYSPMRDGWFAAIILIVILAGGGGSYFTYLLVFMLWRLSVMPRGNVISAPLVVVVLLIAPLWTHQFPTFQQLENPQYGETVRAVMNKVDAYSGRNEPGLVWVSTRIGLPIIDEPYSRVIANYVALGRYPQPITINDADQVLYMTPDEADILFDNYALTPETVQTEIVIPPVRGLLTFESLLRQRLPDIGLWRVSPPTN